MVEPEQSTESFRRDDLAGVLNAFIREGDDALDVSVHAKLTHYQPLKVGPPALKPDCVQGSFSGTLGPLQKGVWYEESEAEVSVLRGVVLAVCADGVSSAGLFEGGVPTGAAAVDAGQVAQAEPGLLPWS
jgi:hypothetical protein